MKVTKFCGNRPKTKKVINRQTKFTWKTSPPPSANRVNRYFSVYIIERMQDVKQKFCKNVQFGRVIFTLNPVAYLQLILRSW